MSEDLDAVLQDKVVREKARFLSGLHPGDIADYLEDMDAEETRKVFDLLDAEIASAVLVELEDHAREELIEKLSGKRLAEIVQELESDDATDLIATLPLAVAQDILKKISPADKQEVEELLRYGDDTAGGLMQAEYVAVETGLTAAQAIEKLRQSADAVERVHNVFAVTPEGRYAGTVHLYDLVTADPNRPIGSLVDDSAPSVTVNLDQEEVAKVFKRYDLISLPVVETDGTLVGRITVDDIVDVIEEEASEDIYRMVGLDEDERVFEPAFASVRKRVPWLLLKLVAVACAALFVYAHEKTILQRPILAAFLPIVGGMGGDAGTQTFTMIIRNLALGTVDLRDTRRMLLKQLFVGMQLGLLVAVVAGAAVFALERQILESGILAGALVLNFFVAAAAGTLVPLTLVKLRVDPAVASGLFVTFLTDLLGFVFVLGIASMVLTRLAGGSTIAIGQP
jgi:magnesium transporter